MQRHEPARPGGHPPLASLAPHGAGRFARAGLASLLGGSVLGVFCLVSAGCRRPGAEARAVSAASSTPVGSVQSGNELTRIDLLLQLLSMPHAELTARLGPHRVESTTRWTITPIGTPPSPPPVQPGFKPGMPEKLYEGAAAWESTAATLEETRVITVDGAGRVQLSSQNDHGAGVEAIFDQDFLYVRMRHAPYIRQHPEGEQLARLRAAAYESGAALIEAVAPYVELGTPTEASSNGRQAWQVKLSRREPAAGERPRGPRGPDGALSQQSAWRAATAVELLTGSATVDRQKGAPVQLSLHVRFIAPRGSGPETEKVQVEAQHTLSVVALGETVPKVAIPSEWMEPPTRPRPTAEQRELLQGLTNGRH